MPAASCRFNLVMDMLAVWLTVPAAKSVGDFPTQAMTPCQAHKIKGHLWPLISIWQGNEIIHTYRMHGNIEAPFVIFPEVVCDLQVFE